MNEESARQGILLMILTMFVFAMQDGISRHLAQSYNVLMIVTIRYWFFAIFVLALARRRGGSIRSVANTRQLGLQVFRGFLLAAEICVMVAGFVALGLVESHAIFACYPLLIAALSGPVLGEYVGWRRWLAIGIGFVGVMIILQPGASLFRQNAWIPLVAALMFALYGLLTRFAARKDSAMTSFFWTGVVGAIVLSPLGLWAWEPMAPPDWLWMAALCATGAFAHWLLIKTYEVASASSVQPFAYLQLVFASALGITVFGETLAPNVTLGAVIVIFAGLFTLMRARRTA